MEKRSDSDFNSLKKFLKSVQSYTQEFIYTGTENTLLYHYTDLSGLNGIIESHDIWLTHSRFSNDDEEITYGYRIVKEVIDKELETAPASKSKFLRELADLVREPTAEGVYTCSFCRKDNLLSQWRGYGANGTGVNIAFKPQGFAKVTSVDSLQKGLMRLWKVSYEEAKQKNIIKQAINFFFSNPDPENEKVRLASNAIQFFIPTFKHSGFEEEKECRLIFTPPPTYQSKPRFRAARGMLIPYYTLQDLIKTGNSTSKYRLPIIEVRIGPSTNKLLNMQSVKMLLDKQDYTNVKVESANIPFRG